ncbi:MAG: MerR family DNA-binding transcriptional regulator, partial [Pseudoclavibacter sp.]
MNKDRRLERRAAGTSVPLRSAELADLAGTTVRALRHYHKIGLLPEAPRDPNGYRRYSARDLVRVMRIRQLAASGMPLRRIGDVLQHDTHSQVELLDELDRDLRAQAAHIETQRATLAELRAGSLPIVRRGDAARPSATEALDRDIWTLVTATGAMDAGTAGALTNALLSDASAEQAAAWYAEFEALESSERLDGGTA